MDKKKLKNLKSKNFLIAGIIVLLVVLVGYFFMSEKNNKAPKKVYEVAVRVVSQNNSNKEEDLKTSLKYGDVLLVAENEHKWSNTEKISYLILKMELSDEEKVNIVSPKTQKVDLDKLSEEERKMMEERGEDDRLETVIAREYRINMEKYFPEFKSLDLLNKQPYQEKVYDWKIVEKKK